MAQTNFEAWRKKQEDAKKKEESKKFSAVTWFKLDQGQKKVVRFLPLKNENLELPFTSHHYHSLKFPDGHYEQVACPSRTEDRECPFCNYATAQYRKYKSTEKEEYKQAFKDLVAKHQYLLVAYVPSEIDVDNITSENCTVFKASAQGNIELLEGKLAKGIDFIDFAEGRDVEISKSKAKKGQFPVISLDFGDSSPAFADKAVWEKLIQVSPDLTNIITPLSDEQITKKFEQFTAVSPVTEEDDSEDDFVMNPADVFSTSPVQTVSDLDIEQLARELDDDN